MIKSFLKSAASTLVTLAILAFFGWGPVMPADRPAIDLAKRAVAEQAQRAAEAAKLKENQAVAKALKDAEDVAAAANKAIEEQKARTAAIEAELAAIKGKK